MVARLKAVLSVSEDAEVQLVRRRAAPARPPACLLCLAAASPRGNSGR